MRVDILGEKAPVIEEWEKAEKEAQKEDSPLRKKIKECSVQLVRAEKEIHTLTISLGRLDPEGPAYETVMNKLIQTEEKIANIQVAKEDLKIRLTTLPTVIDRERMNVWIRTLKSIDKMKPEERQRFVSEIINDARYISEPYTDEMGKEIRLGKGWVPPEERPTIVATITHQDGTETTTGLIGSGAKLKSVKDGIDIVKEPGRWSIVYRVPIRVEESVAQFVKSH